MIPEVVRRRAIQAAQRSIRGLPPSSRELALNLITERREGPTLLPGPLPGPVLVIAPHPDDEVIGPGGAVARHLDEGHDVTVLVITSGGATVHGGADVTAVREAETTRALRHLGLARPALFGRLPDGGLTDHMAEVTALITRHCTRAATVYVPSLHDPHPDHRAVAIATGRAGLPTEATVLGYEVWAAAPIDVLLDVTDVFARKQAALAEYRVALETVDYVRSASGLAAYRSASAGLGGRGFAEGFVSMDAATYQGVVAGLAG